ncbi:MAG: DNA/RNA non-specific endonuclease [Bacteroidales bacterium]|nr:DNA/RNA non-specific endonuclease [Bacteroidales bacterium]
MKRFADIIVLVWAALSLLTTSCGGGASGSGDDPLTAPELTVAKPLVGPEKGSQFVKVSASGSWTLTLSFASGVQPWAKVSPSSGKGPLTNVILSYETNASADDRTVTITLSSGGKSSSCIFTQSGGKAVVAASWLELPAMTPMDGYGFFHHKMTIGGKTERNYSFYYSYSDLVSLWVAYPLVKSHLSGTGRSDAWAYDPLLPADKQANLYKAWKESSTYSRGHQIPSADRLANYAANSATFYFTNMTPQDHTLNGGKWADFENKVRSWAKASDTLYVVTGCVVEGSTKKAHDNDGKEVTIPTGYYKAFLRYASSSSLGYGGYMAGAVYFNHSSTATAQVMSVDALEAKLGMDFFPNLETVLDQTTAAKVEAQDPKTVSWWGL